MTDDEIKNLRRENAELLKEKADAVSRWHEEVRETLRTQGLDIATIKANTNGTAELRARLEKLEERIKIIEDFKIRVLAQGITAMFISGGIITALWKLIDVWTRTR
jgi:hypothetical protein